MNVLYMYIRWIGPSVLADGIIPDGVIGKRRPAEIRRSERSPYSPCLIDRNLVNTSSGLADH